MESYVDIQIRPDAEMRLNVLMNAVYTKLHKALYDLKSSNIGVSFPDCKVTLGNIIRLHGSEAALSALQESDWLGGLGGYCNVSSVLPVPRTGVQYRTVSRWQSNMGESHLRRLIKRGSISEAEIKTYRAKMMKVQLTDLPYLEMKSGSNGKRHRRYIRMGDLADTPTVGKFNTFGLSKSATIPWF